MDHDLIRTLTDFLLLSRPRLRLLRRCEQRGDYLRLRQVTAKDAGHKHTYISLVDLRMVVRAVALLQRLSLLVVNLALGRLERERVIQNFLHRVR